MPPPEIRPVDGMCDRTDDKTASSQMLSCAFDFTSLCEHHLLPFHGKVSVRCTSNASEATMAALKLKETISQDIWNAAHRLQVQERLTNAVADVAMQLEFVQATVVVCEAVHLCMIARGARTNASVTRTVARRGDVPMALIQMTKEAV